MCKTLKNSMGYYAGVLPNVSKNFPTVAVEL